MQCQIYPVLQKCFYRLIDSDASDSLGIGPVVRAAPDQFNLVNGTSKRLLDGKQGITGALMHSGSKEMFCHHI